MKECIFCKILNDEIEKQEVYKDQKVTVILDAFPKSKFHLLIIPNEHIKDILEVDSELMLHINKISKKMVDLIMDTTDAKGVEMVNNFGINQEIKHYHLHLIPIYEVDNSVGYGYLK